MSFCPSFLGNHSRLRNPPERSTTKVPAALAALLLLLLRDGLGRLGNGLRVLLFCAARAAAKALKL